MSNHVRPRSIKRLLIANRGEIAARIISAARELDIETFAVYTENDVSHTYNAAHAVRLQSAASYMRIDEIVKIAKDLHIDAIHPGYGFLSESPAFASALAEQNVMVIGPGADLLARTGDKLQARSLAQECSVPVLPALTQPTQDVDEVRKFAETNGLPIMVKAVDGGGGRGIRLIRDAESLQSLVTRAIEESPSKSVFAERAAVEGFRHVEVQVLGDGNGNVMHLWERECSIQRRYQKVVELAPGAIPERTVVAPLIDAALKIAAKVRYASLGTFEFLLNPSTREFYFLEINPRLQVEHTITESICATDIVKAQIRLAQGASFEQLGVMRLGQDPCKPPEQFAIQFRLTAEDATKGYALSIGKIQAFRFPCGAGVRVDTALVSGVPAVVTSDFDSVLAKIIVTASSWVDAVSKAKRALDDTHVAGVTTNLPLLKAIASHPDFAAGSCDTQWLEAKHEELIRLARLASPAKDPLHGLTAQNASSASAASTVSLNSTLFRRDDAWIINLQNAGERVEQKHHLQLVKVLRNDFPASFAAEILHTVQHAEPTLYVMEMKSTSASGAAVGSRHRRGSVADPSHIIMPLSGKLVEVLVDVGDFVRKDEPICVIKQMKMEVEIRSHRSGRVVWVTEADDNEDVAEGMLAAVVEDDKSQSKL